jgi:hypothetical protein
MSGFYNIEGSPLGDGCCRRYGKCPQGQTCGSGCKCSRGVDSVRGNGKGYSNFVDIDDMHYNSFDDTYSNHPGWLSWLLPTPALISNWRDNKKLDKWRKETSAKNKTFQEKLDASALEKTSRIREEKEQLRLEQEAYRLGLTAEDAVDIEYKRKKELTKGYIFIGVPIVIVIGMIWYTYSKKQK